MTFTRSVGIWLTGAMLAVIAATVLSIQFDQPKALLIPFGYLLLSALCWSIHMAVRGDSK